MLKRPLLMNRKPLLEASRFQEILTLLEVEEIEQLLASMPHCDMFPIGRVITGEVPSFLSRYKEYLAALKAGQILWIREAYAMSTTPLCPTVVGKGYLLSRVTPTIEIRFAHFFYQREREIFLPFAGGDKKISWGIAWRFPTLYRHRETQQIIKTLGLPEAVIFKELQRWLRHHSRPVSFLIDGKMRIAPFRLGHKCVPWIHHHPQLPWPLKLSVSATNSSQGVH